MTRGIIRFFISSAIIHWRVFLQLFSKFVDIILDFLHCRNILVFQIWLILLVFAAFNKVVNFIINGDKQIFYITCCLRNNSFNKFVMYFQILWISVMVFLKEFMFSLISIFTFTSDWFDLVIRIFIKEFDWQKMFSKSPVLGVNPFFSWSFKFIRDFAQHFWLRQTCIYSSSIKVIKSFPTIFLSCKGIKIMHKTWWYHISNMMKVTAE